MPSPAGVWQRRVKGRYENHEPAVQTALEAAIARGDAQAPLSLEGREYVVDFRTEPMRQALRYDLESWRPVRRVHVAKDAQGAAHPHAAAAPASSAASASGAASAASGAPPARDAPKPISLLSYNVWFDLAHTFPTRMTALARIAAAGPPPPSVLAVQEETDGSMTYLAPALAAAGFRQPFRQPQHTRASNGAEAYGVALTTREPLGPLRHARYHPYARSMMGRGLVLGVATWASVGDLALGCTHLESFIGHEQDAVVRQARAAQLGEAAKELEREARTRGCVGAVLMGDMNWSSSADDPTRLLGPGWADAWQVRPLLLAPPPAHALALRPLPVEYVL